MNGRFAESAFDDLTRDMNGRVERPGDALEFGPGRLPRARPRTIRV